MASERVTPGLLDRASASSELGAEWRRLTRAATAVAVIEVALYTFKYMPREHSPRSTGS
jgi:hypothetical protein